MMLLEVVVNLCVVLDGRAGSVELLDYISLAELNIDLVRASAHFLDTIGEMLKLCV